MLHWYSLTRRFTLLRSYNGDPVGLQELKSKFAEQRARGALNQVSEEEEGMILEALGRMRFNTTEPDDNSLHPSSLSPRDSSTDAAVSPSPSPSKSSKRHNRYSNNLFGSGRFRDYSYVRSVQRGSNRSALSFSPSEVSTSTTNNMRDAGDFQRPITPEEGSSFAFSVPSSPNDPVDHDSTPIARSAILDSPSPYASDTNSSSGTEFRLSRTFNQEAFKRASLALEDVIREIEEEAEEPDVDDDIVLLRSPSAPTDHNQHQNASNQPSQEDESVSAIPS
jgi:serine/arginine repetitive matrix protein 2